MCVLSGPAGTAAQASASTPRRILMLYTESAQLPANMLVDSLFRMMLARDTAVRLVTYSEYLDQARFPDETLQREQITWLQRKYRDFQFDVVVALGRLAVSTMTDTRTSIAPGVPLVTWTMADSLDARTPQPGAATGVRFRMDAGRTVQDARRLFPEARELVVIAGSAPIDSLLLGAARVELRPFEQQLRIRYQVGRPQRELENMLAGLDRRTIVLFIHAQADEEGGTYLPRDMVRALARRSQAPIFGISGLYMGTGIVGGRLIDFGLLTEQLFEQTRRALQGEPADRIPFIQQHTNAPAFDVRALRRWRIPASRLPAGSRLEYSTLSAWQRYRWQFLMVIGLCLAEALLIAGLLVQRRERSRAEKLLAERLQFETVLADTSRTLTDVTHESMAAELQRWLGRTGVAVGARAVRILRFDESGARLDVVHAWQRLRHSPATAFLPGRTEIECLQRGVLVTRSLEMPQRGTATLLLVPLSVAGGCWGALALETSSAIPFGDGVPTGRLRVLGEVLANALARNQAVEELVTRTEALTESHEEYRRLADRLIVAQENERKRIARELHDDITQRLTVLGLEADEIGRLTGHAAAVPRPAIKRLTEQLSALIGDVTRLSHRLHPSLLERVGLPAAVRALCRDLSGQQGLAVSFSEHDVPAELPEAQSLAAYRVAQEALRNALKHSGARQAFVHLAVERNTLALEVADDGSGFDTARTTAEGGLGLLSMTERVQVLEGTLSVESHPGSGTRVRVELPLHTDRSSREENALPMVYPDQPSDV